MASLSLFLIFSFFVSLAAAAPWIVTEYYEEIVTVQSAYTDYYGQYTEPAVTITSIHTVPSPTGLSALSTEIITQSDSGHWYDDSSYTVVQVLYPYESVPTTTSSYPYSYEAPPYTSYLVALAYTAPTACSSSWTYTTAVPVYPPIAIQPTSMSTSYSIDNSQPFQPSTITEVYAYVDPTQIPASSLSQLSASYSPYPSCYNPDPPTATETAYSSSSSSSSSYHCSDYGCSDTNWINDSYYFGISPLAIILISVLGWTFVIFVGGLFENYFHFQRLMKGWQARRGLPITWWFWIWPISCLVCLGFSRKGYQARTVEDAQVLRAKWDETGFWKKKALWLRHGFGIGYPSMLLLGENGVAPPRVGRPSSKKPVVMGGGGTQPLLQVSPPGSAAPSEVRVGDNHNHNNNNRSEQPEMSGVLPPQASSTLQVPRISVGHANTPESAERAAEASTANEENAEIHPRSSSEIVPETRHDAQS